MKTVKYIYAAYSPEASYCTTAKKAVFGHGWLEFGPFFNEDGAIMALMRWIEKRKVAGQ